MNRKNFTIIFFGLFLGFAPKLAFAGESVVDTYPEIASKACEVKYTKEISSVEGLLDKDRADKKVQEIKTVRKDQDQTIVNIFDRLEDKVSDEKKPVIEDYKSQVFVLLDDKRQKIDSLQEEIRIKHEDVVQIVDSTLLEQNSLASECPITTTNSKKIHSVNVSKLKKLVEDKKDYYQKQTSDIQDEFTSKMKSTLSSFAKALKK